MNGATCVPVAPDSYFCECPENLPLTGELCNEAVLDGFKYLVIDEHKIWQDAQTSCEELGFNLTSITSQKELNFLSRFVG